MRRISKVLLTIAAVALLAIPAAAQNTTTVSGTVKDSSGVPYSNGSVQAQLLPTGVTPTIPPPCNGQNATPCVVSAFQRGSTDVNGNFNMNLASNAVLSPGGTQWQFTVNTNGAPTPIGTGPQTCSATLTISGASQSISSSFAACPALSTISGGTPPQGNNGDVQIKNGPNLGAGGINDNGTNLIKILRDTQWQGPNPYVDIRAYGARAVSSGSIPTATATCTSGLTSITLGSASTFQNGDGIAISNCGAAQSMSTPTGLVVTPVVANTSTGTGYVVPSATGATQYCYVVVARDQNEGLTAGSTEVCISTGQATLGERTINVTSCSRAIATVTCITSAHTLLVGCTAGNCGYVFITSTSDSSNFNGWFSLDSVADTTHFTYVGGLSAVNGASTSSTSGTFSYYVGNHLALPTPTAGDLQYYVYGRTTGAETYLGAGEPVISALSGDTSYQTFDDFGPTMSGGATLPWFLSNTPPVSATNDTLTTTVTSGAGTTNIVVATPAGNTASGTARFDNAPAILAAYNAITSFGVNGGGMMYIPCIPTGLGVNIFATSSFLDLSTGGPMAVSQAGVLTLGDTMKLSGVAWSGERSPCSLTLQQFGLQANTTISTSGLNPGIWATSNVWMKGLNITSTGNMYNNLFIGPGAIPTGIFENIAFTGGGATDYMGIVVKAFGQQAAGGDAGLLFRNISLNSGPVQTDGVTATPAMSFKNFGEVTMSGMFMRWRGLFFRPNQSGIELTFDMAYEEQGGIMPMLNFYALGSSISGWVRAYGFIPDTMAQPLMTNSSGQSGTFAANVVISTTLVPSSGVPLFSGRPFALIRMDSYGGNISQLGQNYNLELSASAGSYYGNRSVFLTGSSKVGAGQISTPSFAPAAVATTSGCAGGFPSAGTYTYAVFVVDASGVVSTGVGGSTPTGPASANVVLDGSTQCALIPQPTLPVGSVFWGAAAKTGPATGSVDIVGSACGLAFIPVTTLSITDNHNFKCAQPATVNTTSLHILEGTGFFGITDTATELTQGQCVSAASPAVCGSFIDGMVTIAAGASTVVVNTTQVTANSNIQLTFDATKGGASLLNVTCNTTAQQPYVTAIVPGTSFTISVPSNFTTNPGCITYHYKN